MNILIAWIKLTLFFFISLILVPPQIIVLCFTRGAASRPIPKLWMRLVCAIFQIKVSVQGQIFKQGQCLYMSNHMSYLDIPTLGAVLDCSFVSKQDVANWPVFGFLANLRQTAYIGRERADTSNASRAVSAFLNRGESLIIFPEGTSTDGREVIPFKSSLFALPLSATNQNLFIQPVTLVMSKVNGAALVSQDDRDLYAWHRDMDTELPAHLWRFAQSGGAEITVRFHDAFAANTFNDRKALANATFEAVSLGHADLTQRV